MVKISIIIPVYNSERYLKQCLESIINQEFNDIEIICINDGSTDSSLSILKQYGQIKLINKENTGAGDSRNKGLEVAQGEYVLFLDSDDFLEPNALEILYEKASSSDCEVLFFNVYKYFEENGQKNVYNFIEPYYRKFKEEVFSPLDAKDVLFQTSALPFKMYRKDSLIKYNVKYSNIYFVEDQLLFYKLLFSVDKICALNKELYNYRIHPESATQNNLDKFKFIIESFYLCENEIKNCKLYDDLKTYFIKDKIHSLFYWFAKSGCNKKLYYKELKVFLKYIKKIYGENIFKESVEKTQIELVLKMPFLMFEFMEKVKTSIKITSTYLN